MKYHFCLLLVCFHFVNYLAAQPGWQPVKGHLVSEWGQQVNPGSVLQEYPRPQLVRDNNWINLNGLWDYTVTAREVQTIPVATRKKILVPFPIESALSGVGETLGKEKRLWYHRSIVVPNGFSGKRLLLHFGAVDWECEVYINGQKAGSHRGGYDPFTIDISSYVGKSKKVMLDIGVYDPTDEGPQPIGKQKKKPEGIWYTPVTGIWQTVWLEAVPQTYFAGLTITPDIDNGLVRMSAAVNEVQPGDRFRVSVLREGKAIAETSAAIASIAALQVPDPKYWSPYSPFLYDVEVALVRNGKVVDQVRSYFAMRKISIAADNKGIQRIMLNNKFLFQYGTLDQGWWPDGLYTAPSDEALAFDIKKTKEMGFNMIRKHVKVEPARWYYHCDRLGMLVWQDMPSGDIYPFEWEQRLGETSGMRLDKERSAFSEQTFRDEWRNIMNALRPFPSIVVWVPFNESWGQFKTEDITRWTMNNDSTRLVNSASGGNYFPVGHIADLHNYPDPAMPAPLVFGSRQALVLGEFGGLGLPVENHTWIEKGNWGCQSFKNSEELTARYKELMQKLGKLIPLGLSAAIYTQITDVEIETNGLLSYDRKVAKIPEAVLNELHQKLYQEIR